MNLKQFRYHIPVEDRLKTAERILRHRKIAGSCWIWMGFIHRSGYGWTSYKHSVGMMAHRLSYLVFEGDITEGMQLHHKCRVKRCFNPKHLQVVTAKEHMHLDEMPGHHNSIKTHCIRGHEFTKENTQIKHGHRICKACRRIFNNELYARRYSKEVNGGECWVTKKRRLRD